MPNNDDTCECTKCGKPTHYLAVFPGGICLECYQPIGDAEARTMTADKLAKMWGGK
jgi:hypothetical protein